MKLTKETLKRIIKEELEATLRETQPQGEAYQDFLKQAVEKSIASGLSKEEALRAFEAFLNQVDDPEMELDDSPLGPLK